MAEKRTELTREGVKKLEDELYALKTVKRKEIAEKLKEARGQGDLSENAEYDSAKEEQGHVEARIAVLEKMLRTAEIVHDNVAPDEIGFGSAATLRYSDEGQEVTEDYIVVGSAETDPFEDPIRVSNESPLGKALLGRRAGETVIVDAPGGQIAYTIVAVKTEDN